jgi:hypothetical protein
MLPRALELWSATRIIEDYWRITGEETLGIDVVTDLEAPTFGIRPITPIMDTQLDQIVIQYILEPLRTMILEELEEKVKTHKSEDFIETFLTIFILVCSIERNTVAQANFAIEFGFNRRFSNPRLLESYFHAARILLSRFHFVIHGSAAIMSNWSNPKDVAFADLDKEQEKLMEQIKEMSTGRGESSLLSLEL